MTAAHDTTAVAEIYPLDRRDWHTKQRHRRNAEDKAAMLELKKAQNELLREANQLKREANQIAKRQADLLEQLVAALQAK